MVKTMNPEDKKLLEIHIKEIAKILYKNTPPEKIETFEGIETSVREITSQFCHLNLLFEKRRKNRSLRLFSAEGNKSV